ncbi:hypothetical protein M9458_024242 [Cirrhinus mrigala]|uniref:Uncharacterized protein n=1 Tax=Cirrhinus mrigala TaxID=683832 RepID=A0ABD0Q7M4_CIRMR
MTEGPTKLQIGDERAANSFSNTSQTQPPPRLAKPEPEPTVDREPEPRATEPSPLGVTAREIATEPEPIESNQVREPATMPAMVDVPVGREGAEDSTTHCTAEGERCLELGHLEIELDLIDFTEDIYVELPACPEQYACQSPSASWLEDPLSLPRLFDPAAPPRLSAPSSPPSPAGPPAPPGFIVPPAPPWSVVVPPSPQDSTTPAAPRCSVPPAPLGYASVLCRISTSASVARALGSALALRILGVGCNVTPLWTVYIGFPLLCPYMVFPVPFLVKSLLVNHPHLSLLYSVLCLSSDLNVMLVRFPALPV